MKSPRFPQLDQLAEYDDERSVTHRFNVRRVKPDQSTGHMDKQIPLDLLYKRLMER